MTPDIERLGFKPLVNGEEFGIFDTLESAKRAAHSWRKNHHGGKGGIVIQEVLRHRDTGVREYREYVPQKWDREI